MEDIYNTHEYKQSRKAYIAQCAFEYFIMLLVADAFLANLLTSIGISDSYIGVISSFISFAFLFQLLSIFLVKKITNTKKTVITFSCMSQLLFMCIYLIPFMPISKLLKTVLVACFILFAYISNYMTGGVLFKWANSFVKPTRRAEYSAVKEMISLVSGTVFILVMGFVIDWFADIGNVNGGFLFVACVMLILNICNFISLMLIKNNNKNENEGKIDKSSFDQVIKNTLGNKNFRSVIIMTVLANTAQYMTVGFLGTFKTKDLAISIGLIQVINIIGNIGRIAISVPFGKFSDKRSYAVGMRYAYILVTIAFLVLCFTTPASWWLIIIYTVLYNISFAGSNQNSFNIVYSYVDSKYMVQAMAIKNSIGGLCGFLISLLAGRILAYVQSNGNMFLGIHMYGQQLLAAISVAISLLTVLYIRLVIEKQNVRIQ